MTKQEQIGVGWPVSSYSGWGVYGLNLTLQLIRKGRNPVWTSPPRSLHVDEQTQEVLRPLYLRQEHLSDIVKKLGFLTFDFPVLHPLRNDFKPSLQEQIGHGSKNIGVIFFENTEFSEEGIARANEYDLIITGSTWNKNVLKSWGLNHVVNVFQGIDAELFRPNNNQDTYPGRFTVFSGGKLEYRKAQDVVLAVFKEFRIKYKEALLIFAWSNQWLPIMRTIGNSSLVNGVPEVSEKLEIDMSKWLEGNGIPRDSFIDLGRPSNRTMPLHMASADAAIFPNRCEPGTNLVAMETMAVGTPTILSANTGHLDLIKSRNCYPLFSQKPVKPYAPYAGVDGWAEPDVGEALSSLEEIYNDRREGLTRGSIATKSMRQFTWDKQVDKLLAIIDDI